MLRRYFQIFAVVLFAIAGFFSQYFQWRAEKTSRDQDLKIDEPVARWEKRVAHIPRSFIVGEEVGYLADWDIDPLFMPIDQDQEYVLTQYALAPSILRRGGNYPWVIGNFTLTERDDWFSENLKGFSVDKVGFGIYLFSRGEK